ncbi:MAG: [acyl-carrier-protein] S-malonyltransferase [Planctomycetaceae bacterium]|nr:[acyl-carrier-protein] S-malonyltransferase [Planctomycetaceae bacterium]|tara:strand:+ start:399 stop:1310 length:912 start_codon:yes stop_codon:yes gene_type:complete
MSNVAFLFPGQGAQSVGMGENLFSDVPAAKTLFNQASDILGYDLAELCISGPAEKLNTTDHSQPAIFVASLAALESLKQKDAALVESCAATAGLSLGEYTALVFAGVMSFEDGLRVVQERGLAMQAAAELTASGMVSIIGLESEQVEALVNQVRREDEVLQLANYLCPGNIVISGHSDACGRVEEPANEAGARMVMPLAVAGAFHTPLMQPAVDRLITVLENVSLQPPRIPIISNVDAQAHSDPEEIRQLLVQQVVSPVRWEDSMNKLLSEGTEQFYEIGPGRVLRGLLKRIARKVPCENISC